MSSKSKSQDSTPVEITVKGSSAPDKAVRKSFPGPNGAISPVRVAIDRQAHADLIAHAKDSPDAEVCGVLVGQICADDEGRFVHVQAVIKGTAAGEGSTHVTFTQATWTAIHETMDHLHPDLNIVGWYHTHPGFGVEFSEMDLFIQRNFFSAPEQIALVTDPLSGAVAIAANDLSSRNQIRYLPRYWVDGREHAARIPESAAQADLQSMNGNTAVSKSAASEIEQRVAQLAMAVDDLRASLYNFLLAAGMIVCASALVVIGWFIYSQFQDRIEPPKMNGFVPVPVRIGDKEMLIGVSIVNWEVPPDLNSLLLQIEKEKQEEETGTSSSPPDKNPDAKPPAPDSGSKNPPASPTPK